MGRKPIGLFAASGAKRQADYRARLHKRQRKVQIELEETANSLDEAKTEIRHLEYEATDELLISKCQRLTKENEILKEANKRLIEARRDLEADNTRLKFDLDRAQKIFAKIFARQPKKRRLID